MNSLIWNLTASVVCVFICVSRDSSTAINIVGSNSSISVRLHTNNTPLEIYAIWLYLKDPPMCINRLTAVRKQHWCWDVSDPQSYKDKDSSVFRDVTWLPIPSFTRLSAKPIPLYKGRFTHSMPCPCRAHAVPLPCRAVKGLECVFPIWFTQCGCVWFTLAMPRPCHALTIPSFSRPRHPTACGLPARVRLLPATTRSSTKTVIRSIPILHNDPYLRL